MRQRLAILLVALLSSVAFAASYNVSTTEATSAASGGKVIYSRADIDSLTGGLVAAEDIICLWANGPNGWFTDARSAGDFSVGLGAGVYSIRAFADTLKSRYLDGATDYDTVVAASRDSFDVGTTGITWVALVRAWDKDSTVYDNQFPQIVSCLELGTAGYEMRGYELDVGAARLGNFQALLDGLSSVSSTIKFPDWHWHVVTASFKDVAAAGGDSVGISVDGEAVVWGTGNYNGDGDQTIAFGQRPTPLATTYGLWEMPFVFAYRGILRGTARDAVYDSLISVLDGTDDFLNPHPSAGILVADDSLVVAAGSYCGPITFIDSSLSMIGAGPDKTIFTGSQLPAGYDMISVGAGVTLTADSFQVYDGPQYGLTVSGSGAQIYASHILVDSCSTADIYFVETNPADSSYLENMTVNLSPFGLLTNGSDDSGEVVIINSLFSSNTKDLAGQDGSNLNVFYTGFYSSIDTSGITTASNLYAVTQYPYYGAGFYLSWFAKATNGVPLKSASNGGLYIGAFPAAGGTPSIPWFGTGPWGNPLAEPWRD